MADFELAPSLLAADFGYLMRDIKSVEGSVEYLHFDVMDGHYVENISFGLPVIDSLRRHTDLKFYTHLMITNPESFIKAFADAGSDIITFHVECSDDPMALIDEIHSYGCKAGVAIHPDTPIEKILPFADKCELLLVMTVRPGFGGQEFMPESLDRIRAVRKAIDDAGSSAWLSVDGGINKNTIKTVYDAGARMFVTGSSVFGQEDPGKACAELSSCITT